MQTQEKELKKAVVIDTIYNGNPVYKIEVEDKKKTTYIIPQGMFDEEETQNVLLDYVNHCKTLGYEIEYR
jgi:hypothetical protein